MAAECQGRLNGEAPALTDAERKQRQRSRENAAQDEIERLRLVAEAKAKLIAEYVYTPPKDHTGALKSLQSRNWDPKAARRMERRAYTGAGGGGAARTQTQIRPGGRRRDAHDERAASRATPVIAARPARSTPVIPKVIPSNASTTLAPKTASRASIPGRQ
jgi:hypothetical protein